MFYENGTLIGVLENPTFVPRKGEVVEIRGKKKVVDQVEYHYDGTVYEIAGKPANIILPSRIDIDVIS